MTKYCDKCKITVRGSMDICPLCQYKLTKSGNEDETGIRIYPLVRTVYKQYENFFKFLIFFTVSLIIAALAVNVILLETGFWSFFILLGAGCFWVMLYIAIHRRFNIPNNIATQTVLISVLSVLWDFVTGWHGWSVVYVIPITCVMAMITMAIVGKVLRLPITDYMACMMVDALFGIVPVIFYFTGILYITVPSVICISVSIISFFALLIFEGKKMFAEIEKRFHV